MFGKRRKEESRRKCTNVQVMQSYLSYGISPEYLYKLICSNAISSFGLQHVLTFISRSGKSGYLSSYSGCFSMCSFRSGSRQMKFGKTGL